MGEGTSLVNLGDISKPADTLILKISNAVGGIFKPYQIKRVAKAEAEAEKIKAISKIEIDELQQRALARFINEETGKQKNMESIINKALPNLKDDSKPENVEDDWISNFFDKCRLISDEEMQIVWANVLAGEANNPGTFSKRTVNFISSIDKNDAIAFTNVCSLVFNFEGNAYPIVFDIQNQIYEKHSLFFTTMNHLDNIGLLTFEPITGFCLMSLPEQIELTYFGSPITIRFNQADNNELSIGKVTLSQIGQELYSIVNAISAPDILKYTIEKWESKGITVISNS